MSSREVKPGTLDVRDQMTNACDKPSAPVRRFGEFSWVWVALVLIFVASAFAAPGTVRPASLLGVLPFAGVLAIVGIGQTLIIQQHGLDMSIPGMMALSGALAAKWSIGDGSLALAAVVAVIIAALVGLINGYLISRINILPLVATLAVNALLIGTMRAISSGTPISASPGMQALAHHGMGGQNIVVFACVATVVIDVLVRKTILGRRFVAVGANPRAARAAGIAVLRYQIGTYVMAAVFVSISGILLAGYIGDATPTAGNDYLLSSIAVVVVGGTSFSGGRGSVVASGAAALFMTQLQQLVLALGADTSTQLLVQALAIILATTIRNVPFARFFLCGRARAVKTS